MSRFVLTAQPYSRRQKRVFHRECRHAAHPTIAHQKLCPLFASAVPLSPNVNIIFCYNILGTGKSHVLRVAIKYLLAIFPRQVHITASTGVAACNIGGRFLRFKYSACCNRIMWWLPGSSNKRKGKENTSTHIDIIHIMHPLPGTTIHRFAGIGLGGWVSG